MQTKVDETIKCTGNSDIRNDKIWCKPEYVHVHTNLQSAQRPKIDIAEIMACNGIYGL